MTGLFPRLLGAATVGAGVVAAGYVGLVTGACPVDFGIGRRVRALGPQLIDMAAPREVVFDVIAEPYLGQAPRALADKLRVLERGSDMVLAAHFTPLGGRLGLVAQTVETVRFTRPERVDFRLVRGPVGPGHGWSTRGRSGPTCGSWDSAGLRWWRGAGSRRWRPRWPRSRPKRNGADRAPWDVGAPVSTSRPSHRPMTSHRHKPAVHNGAVPGSSPGRPTTHHHRSERRGHPAVGALAVLGPHRAYSASPAASWERSSGSRNARSASGYSCL